MDDMEEQEKIARTAYQVARMRADRANQCRQSAQAAVYMAQCSMQAQLDRLIAVRAAYDAARSAYYDALSAKNTACEELDSALARLETARAVFADTLKGGAQ